VEKQNAGGKTKNLRDPKIDLKAKQLGDIGSGFRHVRAYDFHSA